MRRLNINCRICLCWLSRAVFSFMQVVHNGEIDWPYLIRKGYITRPGTLDELMIGYGR